MSAGLRILLIPVSARMRPQLVRNGVFLPEADKVIPEVKHAARETGGSGHSVC